MNQPIKINCYADSFFYMKREKIEPICSYLEGYSQ
ncbi:hypothetical protein PRO82_000891 [Candidatus Protochlamydia amoebophila]|nr:hypothetical protein [Candidatus Protochlamydia amoebophila]